MKKSKMRKLTYWYARCLTDNDCYSIRAPKKSEAKRMIESMGHPPGHYGPLVKVTVNFLNPLELLLYIKSEGSLCTEENAAEDAWIAKHRLNRDAK